MSMSSDSRCQSESSDENENLDAYLPKRSKSGSSTNSG